MELIEVLAQTELFAGIAPHDIEALLMCLDIRQLEYEKGETVLWEGDIINDIGIVLCGHGRSVKNDVTGKSVIVTCLEKGSFIGVLLAASKERKSPVSVEALDYLCVLFISFASIVKRCGKICPRHDRLIFNILDGIAEKALVLHDRNDCLIKPTVRKKILAYLTKAAKEYNSQTFSIPLDRKSMAEYLNVERSALSRELSQMRTDGIIDFYKNSFRIINSD